MAKKTNLKKKRKSFGKARKASTVAFPAKALDDTFFAITENPELLGKISKKQFGNFT